MTGKGALAAMAVVTLLHSGAASAWEDYPGIQGPGYAGIAIGDFDGNGKLEAVVNGSAGGGGANGSGSELLAVLGADASGKLGVRTISMLPTQLTGALVPAPRQGQADRLAAVVGQGAASQILILGGVPLGILRTIEAPMVRRVAAIADVDADGRLEIVALTGTDNWSDNFPTVLDYETGVVKWTGSQAVTDVGVAQLDGDAALELIMAGTPGRIIDGATHAVEWTYPSGFGNKILVGRFGTDAKVGFATSTQWSGYVQVFRSQPYSPVSEINVGEVAAAAVVRLAPGGQDQVAIGQGQWGDIAIYDPRTGQRLLGFRNPEYGAYALAVGDIDGDGHAELVYGASGLLRAVDLSTITDDYAQYGELGPHSALARGDLQGGGSDQVVYLPWGSGASSSFGPNLYVLDAATGKRLRQRINVFQSSARETPHVEIAQLDGDPQKEIIIAGGKLYNGVVVALDGVSLEDQWRVGGYGSVFDNATINAMATLDVNGDGTPDVIVATSAARLVVLDGRDGSVLWQSVMLNGSTPPSIVGFRTGTGSPRVAVARGAALYLFDLSTGLLAASTKTASGVIGLWQWGDGAACRIAALDKASVVTIHRCDTLASDGERLLPSGSVFFRPLDAQANRFIAASGPYLYEVASNGDAIPMSSALGNQLGAGNKGVLRSGVDSQHFDIVIGSDYMVTRKTIGLDRMFASGFD